MKISIASLTLLAAWSPAFATPLRRRRVQAVDTKIVGGSPVSAGAYPFFATGNKLSGLPCGATLIHQDILLTSAQCLEQQAFIEGVTVNTVNRPPDSGEGQSRTVTHQVRHLEYDDNESPPHSHDIMILKMASPVTTITPIDYSTVSSVPGDRKELTILGFGRTSSGAAPSTQLRQVDIFSDNDTCHAAHSGYEEDRMFCAGSQGKGTCNGDRGGPAINEFDVQVGIVSFETCGQQGNPGVYTRVGYYADWIEEHICRLSSNPPSSCVSTPAPPGSFPVRVLVQNDNRPYENLWYITDSTGEKVAEQERLANEDEAVNEVVNLVGGPYEITMLDSFGDGIESPGGFSVFVEVDGVESLVASSSGNFGSSKTLSFFVGPQPTAAPTPEDTGNPLNGTKPCQDGSGSIQVDDTQIENCTWLSENLGTYPYLCFVADIAIECPVTCGVCNDLAAMAQTCEDQAGVAFVCAVGARTCDWLGNNVINFGSSCGYTEVALKCPATCNTTCELPPES